MTKLIVTDFPRIKATRKSISNRKAIYGIGVNDSDYITNPVVDGKKIMCPFYSTWASMMTRCYSEKYHRSCSTYIGCTVTEEWYSFMNFRSWMIKQDWKGKQLDKDILIPGNKTYSPNACFFVTSEVNGLLIDQAAKRGKYPQGVCWNKEKGKFIARVHARGKRIFLGSFNTIEAAHDVARKAKAEHITNIAQTQSEPIRTALLRHAKLFSDGCDEKIQLCT